MSTRKMLGDIRKHGSKLNLDTTTERPEESKTKVKYNNNIKDIRSVRQLERVNLDFDSPRLKRAMDDLGVSWDESKKK